MKDKILEMAAGVVLDSLIAEDVMGWKERVDFDVVDGMVARYIPNTNDVERFSPSIDISAAWEVIGNLSNKGYLICLNSVGENAGGFIRGTSRLGDWHCNVQGIDGEANHVYETSAPEAICKAALLAVMDS